MKIVLKYLGYVVLLLSVFELLPITVALAYGEDVRIFLAMLGATLFAGFSLSFYGKEFEDKNEVFSLEKALILTALCFVSISAIGAIAFMPSMQYSYIDSFFESVSGFTTTGLSVYDSLEPLPKSVLFWRAETQWLGGLGIFMIFLLLFSHLRPHSYDMGMQQPVSSTKRTLYAVSGFPSKLKTTVRDSTRRVVKIYFSYTFIGIFLLMLSGLGVYEAIAMCMTSLSTGGFSVTDSIAHYTGLQLLAVTVLMVLGCTSMAIHARIFDKKFKALFDSVEFKAFCVLAGTFIAMSFGSLAWNVLGEGVAQNFKVAFFEVMSALTTTGFTIIDINFLPHLFVFLIIICMVIGGGLGSTSGGIKLYRFVMLVKSIPWTVKKLASPPGAVINLKVGDSFIESRDALLTLVFIGTYLLGLVAGTIVLLALGYSLMHSAFQSASAIGTIGLSTIPLRPMHFIGKSTLIVLMLLGRLEVFPFIILLKKALS
jgi:trk system potassium uptake protein TrkH